MTSGTDKRVRVTFEGGGQVEVVETDAAGCGKRQVMVRTGRGNKVKERHLCFTLFQ